MCPPFRFGEKCAPLRFFSPKRPFFLKSGEPKNPPARKKHRRERDFFIFRAKRGVSTQKTDFERNFCEREFLRTRILILSSFFLSSLLTNLNARFIFFHRAGGNTFLQNLLFPPAERERDLFKKEFRERERERLKTYNIHKESERKREKFWADRAASSRTSSFWSEIND